jgi:DNA-binding NtrC family response regulator
LIRALLVDDAASNRFALGALLELEGVEVDFAESYAQASLKFVPGGIPYDLVLLDEHLGDGLGTQLAPTVRARLPGVCIVLVTGSIGRDAMAAARACAAIDAVVAKGADFDDMMTLLRGLLDRNAQPVR